MLIIPQGRPFIAHLLVLASSAHALEDLISLSQECRDELRLWTMFLNNGTAFPSSITTSFRLQSTSIYSQTRLLQLVSEVFTKVAGSRLHGPPQSSSLAELYPLVVAAFLWGNEWSSKCILVLCDNEAVVQCVNKGRSHSPALTPFLRRLKWISACDQYVKVAKHVAGSENQIADSLSRCLTFCIRNSGSWLQRRTNSQPQYLHIHN